MLGVLSERLSQSDMGSVVAGQNRFRRELTVQNSQCDLHRVGGWPFSETWFKMFDLEQFHAHETGFFLRPSGRQPVSFSPFANEGRISLTQMFAELGVIGEPDLRGMTVDRPGLCVGQFFIVSEVGVWPGQGAPGSPSTENLGAVKFSPQKA